MGERDSWLGVGPLGESLVEVIGRIVRRTLAREYCWRHRTKLVRVHHVVKLIQLTSSGMYIRSIRSAPGQDSATVTADITPVTMKNNLTRRSCTITLSAVWFKAHVTAEYILIPKATMVSRTRATRSRIHWWRGRLFRLFCRLSSSLCTGSLGVFSPSVFESANSLNELVDGFSTGLVPDIGSIISGLNVLLKKPGILRRMLAKPWTGSAIILINH